jgi:hypothetical protein
LHRSQKAPKGAGNRADHGQEAGNHHPDKPCKAAVCLIESSVDLFESSVDLFESSVDLFELSVDLFELSVDLFEPAVHLLAQLSHFVAYLAERLPHVGTQITKFLAELRIRGPELTHVGSLLPDTALQ